MQRLPQLQLQRRQAGRVNGGRVDEGMKLSTIQKTTEEECKQSGMTKELQTLHNLLKLLVQDLTTRVKKVSISSFLL
ncbi:kinesin heavy chain-like [Amphiprion ocellaris]|uniref:kinesin heavy chain-like n=1 Tax=Amphiprion ocellaris TaxID=80972 RepID=UPI0024119A09|nr:kinesin heavy chain-like [Amphiprion ocellaris]